MGLGAVDYALPAVLRHYLERYGALSPEEARRVLIDDADLDLQVDHAPTRYRLRKARLSQLSRGFRVLARQGLAWYEVGPDGVARYWLRDRRADAALERLLGSLQASGAENEGREVELLADGAEPAAVAAPHAIAASCVG
jgi:hypothetical protein